MTLREWAFWVVYSNWSVGLLCVLVAVTLAAEYMYLRAHRKHNDFVEAMYIDKDDPHPDMTLDIMRTECFRLRELIAFWVKRFYWAIGLVLVYAVIVAAASHYVR